MTGRKILLRWNDNQILCNFDGFRIALLIASLRR